MGKKLFLFAAAAVALASCTETDLSGDTSFAKESTSDAIQFSAKAGNAGTTRAGVAGTQTTASLKGGNTSAGVAGTGFGVMGYNTGETDWASSTAPNFMYNEQITWNNTAGAGYWTYDPVKYWPNGEDEANEANSPSETAKEKNVQKLSFFAYGPWVDVASSNYTSTGIADRTFGTASARSAFLTYTTANLGNGIAAITANTLSKDPEVYYYMPTATTQNAVDLLWGLRGSKVYNETDGIDNGNTTDALGNSYNVNLTKQVVPETVNFLFKHALSKIGGNTSSKTSTSGQQVSGFKVVLDVDGNGNGLKGVDNQSLYLGSDFTKEKTLVTIKSVKIQDGKSASDDANANVTGVASDLKNSGWFNLAKGTWDGVGIIQENGTTGTAGATYNITSGADTYVLNPLIAENATLKNTTGVTWQNSDSENQGYTGGAEGVETTAKNVFANTKSGGEANDVPALLLIPSADPQTLYVTVDYFVRTADKQLSQGFSQVEQVITNKVSLSGLETNKYYTLVMHLGLTSVKFSAIVADWANSDDASYDEGGTTDGPTEASEEVWLPSNVVAINTTKASTPELGTSINDNVAANATTYTITLKDLKNGQTISATKAGNAKTVKIGETDLTTSPYYTLTADAATTTVNVTLDPNTTLSPVSNKVIITQKSGDNTLSTTNVNIVQAAYNIKLTETAAGTVTVKDDADATVATGYTVEIKDATTGATLPTDKYTNENGVITINQAGTYNVIVTYTNGGSVTKTIKTTKVTP